MPVRVQIPTPMRQHTEGKAVVEVAGTTVQTALNDLGQKYPGITERLFDKRTVERNIKKTLIGRKDYEKHLKTLPDVASKGVYGGKEDDDGDEAEGGDGGESAEA